MTSSLAVKDPSDMQWVASKVPGCFSKKLFIYGPANLSHDGAAGSYTTLYRIEAGASYPAWRLADGSLEIQGLVGTGRDLKVSVAFAVAFSQASNPFFQLSQIIASLLGESP